MQSKRSLGGFLCGPVVKNLLCKKRKKNLPYEAGVMGSIPGWGTKIPCATKPVCCNRESYHRKERPPASTKI